MRRELGVKELRILCGNLDEFHLLYFGQIGRYLY